jgi:outer membrane protein OmpU
MNNFKKIGLTALAGSLVATSVFSEDLTVTGSASVLYENLSGTEQHNTKAFSMGNSVNFAGSGTTEGGLDIALAFELDQGAADGSQTADQLTSDGAVFDSHSVSIGNDTIGTFVFSGHGGSSAQGALDTTAAGDMWDNFDATGDGVKSSVAGNNLIGYTLPVILDGLEASTSYAPKVTATSAASYSWGLTYTGVENLTLSYGKGDDNTTKGSTAEATSMSVTYKWNDIEVAYSDTEYDDATATDNRDVDSMNISYTVDEDGDLTVGYGREKIVDGTVGSADFKVSGFNVAYTTGGMTITAVHQTGDNVSYTTAASEDKDYYSLGLAFAF